MKVATYLDSLVQLSCWGGHCKQMPLACVGSAHSGWTTLGLQQHKVACTSQVYTAQASGYSAGALSQVGPVFHGVPRSRALRFSGALQVHRLIWAMHFVLSPCPSRSSYQVPGKYTVPGGLCVLFTSPVLATGFPRCAMNIQSQVCHVSPLGSWSQAVTHLADVNCPGCQEDGCSNGEYAHSLVEDAVSGAKTVAAPCIQALAVTYLHLCLQREKALFGSKLALLCYLLSPLLCEHARGHSEALEPFAGKVFLSLFLSLWQSHISYLTLAPSDCPQGTQAQFSPYGLMMQPTSPCQAHTCWWQMGASGSLLHWQLQLGAYSVLIYLFFSPSYVAHWDSKPPQRYACERVSYCLETSPPSQLHP